MHTLHLRINTSTMKKILAVLLLSLVISFSTVWFMNRYEMKVVCEWKQPDTIDYTSFGPYYLSVVSADIDWHGFPIHTERNYFIYVGRESGKPTYGHMIKFSFHPTGPNTEDFIKQSVVEWNDSGVIFTPQSGHQLFIPKDMFIGGR